MAKVSMLEASKLFNVARPTILKHIKQGKISAEKVETDKKTYWQIDMSELSRVYKRRSGASSLHEENAPEVTNDLHAEIRVLQAKLEAAQAMAEERKLHLEDLRKQLSGPPQEQGPRRRWWPFK